MSENEKELLHRFLKWLFDSGLEPLEARFENVAAPDIQSVIDKFEKNEADCRNHTMKPIEGEIDLSSMAFRTRFFDLNKIANILERQKQNEKIIGKNTE